MKILITLFFLSLNTLSQSTSFETCLSSTRSRLQTEIDLANATAVPENKQYLITRSRGSIEGAGYVSTFIDFATASASLPNPPNWAWLYSCEDRVYKDQGNNSGTAIVSSLQKNYLPPKAQHRAKACGSVIDYDKGTVLERVPISGTSMELVYHSGYNASLNNNKKVDVSFSILLNRGYDTKIVLRNQADLELDTQYYSGLFDFVNYSNTSSFPEALVEDTEFFSRYEFKIGLYRSISLATPREGDLAHVDQYWIPNNYSEGRSILVYKPGAWGLAGWTLSNHHYFDKFSKTLFTGYGELISYEQFKTLTLSPYGSVNVLADLDNGEVLYIFDQQGRHLETRDTTWNKSISTFSYSGNHLSKVKDRFGLETIFNYDVDNKLVSIKSPYGLITGITINNGNMEKIINPIAQEYLMSYGTKKELLSYKNINDEVTSFIYSSEGFLLREQKNSGLLQEFSQEFIGVAKNLHHKLNNFFSGHRKTELPSSPYTTPDSGPGVYTSVYDTESRLISKASIFQLDRRKEVVTGEESLVIQYNQSVLWSGAFTVENILNRKLTSLTNYNENFRISDNWSLISESDLSAQGGRVTRITQGNKFWNTIYSLTNKTITYTDSENNQSVIKVNDLGLPLEIQSRNKPTTYLSYDTQFRLIKRQGGTQFENYSYDQFGNLSEVNNSKGQKTQFIRNQIGQVLKKILPNGDSISFEYVAGGGVKKMTLPNGEVHNFSYSLGDYLISHLAPGNKNIFYEYDSDKRLTKVIKPSGGFVKYNYRLNSENIDNIETELGIRKYSQIDEKGRVRDLTSEDGIRLEVSWISDQINEQKWYDQDGSLIASISNGFRNDMLRVNSIRLNGVEFANYSSGDIGSASFINNKINCMRYTNSLSLNCSGGFGNDFIIDKSMDENQTILKVSFGRSVGQSGTSSFEDHRVEISKGINFFQEVENIEETHNVRVNYGNFQGDYYELKKSQSPDYDANGRLIRLTSQKNNISNNNAILNENRVNEYVYPLGSNNNVKEYLSNSKKTIASHSKEDQLMKLTGSVNKDYQYTDDGDLKSYTNCKGTTNFEYDIFGNLKKVVLPEDKIIEYKVDGLNRRIKKMVNGQVKEYYLWYDQIHLAAILDENKQPKVKYIYTIDSSSASIIEKSGVLYKIVHDPGLGSIRFVVNVDTKEVVQEIEYDELGNMTYNSNKDFQPLGYAGGLFDVDTGLTRFGARDYDPTIGRWTTKDPIGFKGGDTNLYNYVANNPLSYIDPLGFYRVHLMKDDLYVSAITGTTFGFAGLISGGPIPSLVGIFTGVGVSIWTGVQVNQNIKPSQDTVVDIDINFKLPFFSPAENKDGSSCSKK